MVRVRIRSRIHETNHVLIDIRWKEIDNSQGALWVKKDTSCNKENNNNANDRDCCVVHLQGGIGFICVIHDIHDDHHSGRCDRDHDHDTCADP